MNSTSLGKLEEVVGKACKGDPTLLEMNLAIARSTHEYAQQHGLTAEQVYARPVTLAFGHTYQFGAPLLLRSATRAFTFFPDLRRTNQLSPMGCRFVFSMMHQRWRENDPDMSDLGLVVWRYQNDGVRSIRPIECLNSALLSYEELSSDVRETYQILHELMHAQANGKRGDAGHPGPLFGTA